MKNAKVNGFFTHDLMVVVIGALYPHLRTGRDYSVAQLIDLATGEQQSNPFIASWNVAGIEQPDDDALRAEFESNEAAYRATYARLVRNSWLLATDGRANATDIPAGSPELLTISRWRTYRQALRDIPQQAGFPMNIDWPELPG